MECRNGVIEKLRRNVRTGCGELEVSYENSFQDDPLNGEVKGKGDVASLWCLMSHTILNAHEKSKPFIKIPGSTKERNVKKNNDAFLATHMDMRRQRIMGVKQKMKQLNHSKLKLSHGQNL